MRSTGQRNLILGLAEGLDWEQLRPFVESLAQTSFAGELRLFVGRTDGRTLKVLREKRVILHPYRLRDSSETAASSMLTTRRCGACDRLGSLRPIRR